MSAIPDGDQALFAQLARIADEIDPVPELAYELGRTAFELRSFDSELAELVRDSAAETELMAGVRGGLNVRLLSFEAADSICIDLQVVPQAGRRSLLGQVAGVVAQVRVESTEGVVPVSVDPHGRFQVADLPAGRMRLQVDAAGATYVTSWVTI
ncbi:MAG: carboxypeptidase-like regulatory domain-containing protein [Pseudonocardiales bacterium]